MGWQRFFCRRALYVGIVLSTPNVVAFLGTDRFGCKSRNVGPVSDGYGKLRHLCRHHFWRTVEFCSAVCCAIFVFIVGSKCHFTAHRETNQQSSDLPRGTLSSPLFIFTLQVLFCSAACRAIFVFRGGVGAIWLPTKKPTDRACAR